MNTDKIYAEAVANEYSVKNTSKVIALKKLDRKAKAPANIFAYSFGIATSLLMGVGMCLSMKVIGNGSTSMVILGVILGLLGIIGAGLNYMLYKKILARGKEKYAYDIIKLANEISNED